MGLPQSQPPAQGTAASRLQQDGCPGSLPQPECSPGPGQGAQQQEAEPGSGADCWADTQAWGMQEGPGRWRETAWERAETPRGSQHDGCGQDRVREGAQP